jgi:hypothetical protein
MPLNCGLLLGDRYVIPNAPQQKRIRVCQQNSLRQKHLENANVGKLGRIQNRTRRTQMLEMQNEQTSRSKYQDGFKKTKRLNQLDTGGNPGFQEQTMYTVEYYDDEDMRPVWCVVEWSENPHRGITIDRCDNQAEAESLVVAYSMIHRLTMQ